MSHSSSPVRTISPCVSLLPTGSRPIGCVDSPNKYPPPYSKNSPFLYTTHPSYSLHPRCLIKLYIVTEHQPVDRWGFRSTPDPCFRPMGLAPNGSTVPNKNTITLFLPTGVLRTNRFVHVFFTVVNFFDGTKLVSVPSCCWPHDASLERHRQLHSAYYAQTRPISWKMRRCSKSPFVV